MTLCMTIVAPWGVWQCSDFRVTYLIPDVRHRRYRVDRREDLSVKNIAFQCRDGAALLTYSGLAKVGDDHISDWLRRLLRGQTRTLDETLICVRQEADARLAGPARWTGHEHTFLVGAFLQGRPWAVVISNLRLPRGSPLLDHFQTIPIPPERMPEKLVIGEGKAAISSEDRALLERITHRRPSRPQDYSRVLANIHRRAKHSNHPARHSISEGCMTTFMPPSGSIENNVHWDSSDLLTSTPRGAVLGPLVHHGVDMKEIIDAFAVEFRAWEAGEPVDEEEFKRLMNEAGRRATEPPTP